MTATDIISGRILAAATRGSVGVAIWMLLSAIISSGQTTATSATDGTTPLGITPGSPAGSYALSGFDNINPYNGNLNFRLPLLHIGGRGGAQTTIMLALNTKTWHVKHSSHTDPQGGTTDSYAPTDVTWNGLDVGYGPGVLIGRQTGVGTFSCPSFPKLYVNTLTRLTFKAPDGTEYELRDQATNGQPLPVNSCSSTGPSRGTVFVSADGTAVTFVSDTAVSDNPVPQGAGGFIYPSGFLMLRDGTRYRIDGGLVTWIRDRNGNNLSFGYDSSSRVSLITDSLNRQVTINYKVTDVPPFDSYGKCDQIIFKGFGGTQRIIRVFRYNLLDTALRSDYQASGVQTSQQLFPELNGSDATRYDPKVVTAVYLPDGNLRYQFFYSPYGELARVVLPTGGAIEYDTTGDQPATTHSGVVSPSGDSDFEIYRRVIERRVKPDGSTLEGKMVCASSYSGPSDPTPWTTTTTIDHMASDQTTRLACDKHYFNGSPINSLFQTTPAYLYPAWNESKEYQTDQLDSNGTTLLRSTADTFRQRIPPGQSVAVLWWNSWATQNHLDTAREPANDPRLTDTVTSLTDTTPNLMAKQHFDYDQYNNKSDIYEYDFGSGAVGSLVRRIHTGYVTANVGANYDTDTSIHIRSLPSEQWVSTDSGGTNKIARTTYEYDHYNQTTTEDFRASLTDRSNITGLDGSFSTGYYTRGNVTKTTRSLFDTNGNETSSISGYAQYDIAGNVVETIDPRSTPTNIIATTFDFSDRFGSPTTEAQSNAVPLELTNPPRTSYAFGTKVTNAFNQHAFTKYDYYLGKPVNSEDANQVVSSGRYGGFADGSYIDMLDRPTEVIVAANVSSLTRRTRFTYSDSSHLITTQSDQTNLTDAALKTEVLYDGLGRTIDSRGFAPEGVIHATQSFDAMGRVSQVSNPYRATNEATYGSTLTSYDALGRVRMVTAPDTAAVTTTYLGNATTVTDQEGKTRQSVTDGLGRLVQVIEDPNGLAYSTTYGYDVLDDLTAVTQGGQTRSFTYDSLKRLTQAFNPESGTISYTYDANSNLFTRQDARGITTHYFYDALNRVTSRTYTDSTPSVSFYYDAQTLPIGYPSDFDRGASTGRLIAVTYGGTSAGSYAGYDQLGRTNVSYQQTDSQNYKFTYGYNLASEMTSEIYPSLRTITNAYDTAGRLTSVNGQKTGESNKPYASSIGYAAQGAVSSMTLGNNLIDQTAFNNRLQPTQIKLGTTGSPSSVLQLDYTYSNSNPNVHDNNGNVLTQTITIGSTVMSQSYAYDALNRLQSASENSGANWSQTYGYDRFGNRWVSASTGYTLSSLTPTGSGAFDTSNNRLVASGYDGTGNQTSDAQGRSFTYDAENRQLTFNGTTGKYFYDGDGRRAQKIDSSGTTVFVYNAGGQLIAEYHSDPVPSPAGGGGTSYLTSDHLGSTRVVTDSLGVVKARYDYLPFGEELPSSVGGRDAVGGYGGADSTRQKFTQKERDSESGLDYFLARYYSSPQGRFTSTDRIIVTSERLVDPQEINLYNYARNNPLRFTDPTGEDIDDSSLNKNKNYQGWKKAYLSTNAGRSEWDKYANDHSITITISMGTNAGGKEGAETTPTFDSKGRLTSATIVLGTNFAKNDRLDSTDYPVTSSLVQSAEHSNSTIDRTTRAVDFLAHEFGHVDDDQKQGALWVQQTELMKQNLEGYGKEGQAWFNTSQYQKIVSELGDTPANISTQREVRADGAVIPVLRDYYAKGAGHGSMPSRVKQAIQNYEKAHPR